MSRHCNRKKYLLTYLVSHSHHENVQKERAEEWKQVVGQTKWNVRTDLHNDRNCRISGQQTMVNVDCVEIPTKVPETTKRVVFTRREPSSGSTPLGQRSTWRYKSPPTTKVTISSGSAITITLQGLYLYLTFTMFYVGKKIFVQSHEFHEIIK